MKNFLTLVLSLMIISQASAQNTLPIYENCKVIKQFDMKLNDDIVFIEAPFAKPQLTLKENQLQDKEIKKITYLYSYNNNYPNFAQNSLSDKRYFNLADMLSGYDLSNVEWETNAQAGCGEIPCSEGLYHGFVIEYKNPAEVLNIDNLDQQDFTVDNTVESTITGEDGTKLTIPANAFIDPFGNPVTGDVDVELTEAVTIQDIVMGGLYTVTDDGKVLESKGMIQVKVTQNNQELELNENAEITVELPTTYEDGYMYFEGEHGEHGVEWTNPVAMENESNPSNESSFVDTDDSNINRKVNQDEDFMFEMVTSKEMMAFFPLKANYKKGELVSVLVMNFGKKTLVQPKHINDKDLMMFGFNQGQADTITNWFANDTVVHEKLRWQTKDFYSSTNTNMYGLTVNDKNTQGTLSNNIFKMKKTGWANCDKFSKSKESAPTVVDLGDEHDFSFVQMSMVVTGVTSNVLLSGRKQSNGTFWFPNIPKGEKAVIIATCEDNGSLFMAIEEFTIEDNTVKTLEPLIVESEEQMNKAIKKAL